MVRNGGSTRRGGAMLAGAAVAVVLLGGRTATADVVVLPDGRVFLELEDISEFATGPFAPVPRARPFDDSIEGYFDALNFLFLNQAGPQGQFDAFSRAAASGVDRVPVPSGATSIVYEYDPALETYVQREAPMNPAISQNARTNGRRTFTFGYAYTHTDYEDLDGQDRRRVLFSVFEGPTPNPFPSVPDPQADFVGRLDYRLTQQIFAFSATYGVLENLDIGVLVPLIDVDFRGRLNGRFFGVTADGRYRPLMFDDEGNLVPDDRLRVLYPRLGGIDNVAFAGLAGLRPEDDPATFNPFAHVPLGATHEVTDFGVGDVVFRSRAFIGSAGPVDFGASVNAIAPTGDESNLLGLPGWRFDPRMLASMTTRQASAHVNLGYHADVDDSDRDRFDYSVGAEVLTYRWLTILVDQIGRLEVRGDRPIRAFDVAPGVKLNPFGEVIVGFNAILPLNDEGLTTTFTPNATAEVSLVF